MPMRTTYSRARNRTTNSHSFLPKAIAQRSVAKNAFLIVASTFGSAPACGSKEMTTGEHYGTTVSRAPIRTWFARGTDHA